MVAEGEPLVAGEKNGEEHHQPQSWNMEGYTKAAQEFVSGTLQRTGTLYESTKEAVVKRSGSIYEGAKQGINQGLKRSGTLYQSAQGGVSEGLKRSGTVVGEAKDGIMRRASVLYQSPKEGEPTVLQRTGTFFQQTGQGVIQRTGSWFEGASSYAYSFYDPTAPIKVSVREIAGLELPRTNHTICVIDGRAYVFGGEIAPGQLADNAVHVVILPSSGVPEADYKSIQARPKMPGGPLPEPRKGHTAVAIGTEIFIFGGELSPKAKEEAGRVWVFDTFSSRWSYLDPPADSPYPQPRSLHAAVASEEPTPERQSTAYKPQLASATSKAAEESDAADLSDDSHGTIFIYGGLAQKSEESGVPELLNDVWAFDVASASWLTLPPPSAPASAGGRLALVGPTLFRVNGHDARTGEWSLDHLRVSDLFRPRPRGDKGAVALPGLLSEWTSAPLGRVNVDASEMAVATALAGQSGKHYVLVATGAGNMLAVDVTPTAEGGLRAAGAEPPPEAEDKSVVRQLHKVQTRFVDAYGDVIEGSEQATGGKLLLGSGFAFANGSQAEESHLVVWGGQAADGKPVQTGWMVRMDL